MIIAYLILSLTLSTPTHDVCLSLFSFLLQILYFTQIKFTHGHSEVLDSIVNIINNEEGIDLGKFYKKIAFIPGRWRTEKY